LLGRRGEEKVDVEELARLENPEGSSDGKIRVKMPDRRVNQMFALASQILGGRRVTVLCEDGETRLARIPGKMRRRQWVREGDLIIVWPWDFQDANLFASGNDNDDDEDDLFGDDGAADEGDDLFADDGDDEPADDTEDVFAEGDEDDGAVEADVPPAPLPEDDEDDDDDDDDVDALFA